LTRASRAIALSMISLLFTPLGHSGKCKVLHSVCDVKPQLHGMFDMINSPKIMCNRIA